MTRLFRSKSAGLQSSSIFHSAYPPDHRLSLYLTNTDDDEEDEEDEENDLDGYYGNVNDNTAVTTPFTVSMSRQTHQLPITAILLAALRKSMVICSLEREDVASSLDISWPTNVRHVSHVTFDRFNGFLGLPVELEPELPQKVPSASASVFGVSANSMQCSFDQRGNSVPTILLLMQKRLYLGGGLQAEGIFRINPENSQEKYVRNHLNRGVVPRGIDVHCLAGLIKAWFRELPTGVLDSLTPEQVMHCNTEDECTQLVNLLPTTEAALLDWALNLMADVVQHENNNKMNARNIAMIFAPNMTQMADPLTALIHAVQVMNFLKTLIVKILREREESQASINLLSSSKYFERSTYEPQMFSSQKASSCKNISDGYYHGGMEGTLEGNTGEEFRSLNSKTDSGTEFESVSGGNSPVMSKKGESVSGGYENGGEEGKMYRLNLRKGMLKLCRHPVFQLNKPVKKTGGLRVVNNRAWA